MYYIYINLDWKKNRNRHMIKLLQKHSLSYERFKAIEIDENQLPDKELHPRIISYLNNVDQVPRGLGVIGCYLSHVQVIKNCMHSEEPYIAILEDDIYFTKKQLNYIDKIIAYLEKNTDWDILRMLIKSKKSIHYKYHDQEFIKLGWFKKLGKFNSVNEQSNFEDKRKNKICGSAQMQIIKTKNIPRILEYLEKESLYNIDSVLSTNRLNIFFLTYPRIKHSYLSDESSIPKL